MNTTILQKCLDELNKEDFRKDYVVGMLETLIEMQTAAEVTNRLPSIQIGAPSTALAKDADNEAAILDARARAAIETVRALSNPTNEQA